MTNTPFLMPRAGLYKQSTPSSLWGLARMLTRALFALLLLAGTACGDDLQADASNYLQLQAALDSAQDGDHLLINVTSSFVIVFQPIVVRGGISATIAGSSADGDMRSALVTSSDRFFEVSEGANLRLERLDVSGGFHSQGGAVAKLEGAGDFVAYNCSFFDNVADVRRGENGLTT